jgi:hypothetical protein
MSEEKQALVAIQEQTNCINAMQQSTKRRLEDLQKTRVFGSTAA